MVVFCGSGVGEWWWCCHGGGKRRQQCCFHQKSPSVVVGIRKIDSIQWQSDKWVKMISLFCVCVIWVFGVCSRSNRMYIYLDVYLDLDLDLNFGFG